MFPDGRTTPPIPGAPIRPARQDDADEYIRLLQQLDEETSFLAWEPGERRLDVGRVRERFRDLDSTKEMIIVAERDGRLVGFLVGVRGTPRRNSHRASFTMGVERAAWGLRIGVGLLAALEAWARREGIGKLELTVMAHNERAIGLYEKHGYEREGVRRSAMVVDGVDVDEVLMGKILPPSG